MKKIILGFLMITSVGFSQNVELIEEFTDLDGLIHYTDIIETPNKTKESLYTLAKSMFVDNFKSANSVIQFDDKENFSITGKGNSNVVANAGMGVFMSMKLNYIIKIECKDFKIRYNIYGFNFESQHGTAPAEGWFYKNIYYKKNGKPKSINEQVKTQTLAIINSLQTMIKDNFLKESTQNKNW